MPSYDDCLECKGSQLDALLRDALKALRTHFDLEVAFISEFTAGRRIYRYVDSVENFRPIAVGGWDLLDETYCQRVVDGRLPCFIPNAARNAEALTLPGTRSLPIGAFIGAPIRIEDGEIFGTLCCFSREPRPSFDERDIASLRLYADFVGRAINGSFIQERAISAARDRVRGVLDQESFDPVFQPIFHVGLNEAIGYEMLTRFTADPVRPPNLWMEEAGSVGLQHELEIAVIRKGLRDFHHFPREAILTFNISPATILADVVPGLFEGYPLDRIVVEVTEHSSIEDYSQIESVLAPLRVKGLRIAVDDAGAGYASFRHILKLKPNLIKLDASLVERVHTESSSRALAAAIVRFAEETGSRVVAEGVETEEELDVLRSLKVDMAQGYLLGRPSPLKDLAWFAKDGATTSGQGAGIAH